MRPIPDCSKVKKGLNRSQSQPVLDFTDFFEATSGGLEVERKGRSWLEINHFGHRIEGEKKTLTHTFLVNMMTLFLHSRLEIGRVEGTNMGSWIPLQL